MGGRDPDATQVTDGPVAELALSYGRLITYIAEDLICLARTDGVLLIGVAGPLVQVGAVDDIAQHVLAPLGHFVGDDVGRDVSLGFVLMVVLLVQPLFVEAKAHHGEKLTPLSSNAGNWMITSEVFLCCKKRTFARTSPLFFSCSPKRITSGKSTRVPAM